MRLTAALGAFAAALLQVSDGWACACGVPGLDSSLTTDADTWGARASETAVLGSGNFDAHGRYRAYTADARYLRQDVLFLLAYRASQRLELSALSGYSHEWSGAGSALSSTSAAADTFVRARLEAWDQTPWHRAGLPLPSVTFIGSVRAPTGKLDGTGSGGLGTWEAALGVALERDVNHRFRLGWLGEAGIRAPDSALGLDRRLGPRIMTQLNAWYWPDSSLVASLSAQLTWEGDVALAGVSQPGTASRYLQAGASVVYAQASSHVRPGISLRQIVPISGLGVNALVATSVELSLGYVR